MAFTSGYAEITLRYMWMGQHCQTARIYAFDDVITEAASPDQLGEAWWNHYKTAWRNLAVSAAGQVFQTVFVREVGGTQTYGEYSIPVGERTGTRSPTGLGDQLPSSNAAGVRLTVGTSLTRPGQFRVSFLYDSDKAGNLLSTTYATTIGALALLYSQGNTLGVPVAGGEIFPSVATLADAPPHAVVAAQPTIGYSVSPTVTTQTSRRFGRGA